MFNFREINSTSYALVEVGTWSSAAKIVWKQTPQWTAGKLDEPPSDTLECDDLLVVSNGACKPCNVTDYYDRNTKRCLECPSGQEQSSSMDRCGGRWLRRLPTRCR